MNQQTNYFTMIARMLLIACICARSLPIAAQCNPNFIYGFTNLGRIQRITTGNGAVQAPINPAFPGPNPANYSNALGYNPLNGKYYFFKRNSIAAPQEFMSFDPAFNTYQMLAPSPAGTSTIINLGCVNNSGLGYYCLDAYGVLFYYSVATNTWTTICSNIRNQFGTTLASIIDATGLQRFYGDLAIDGTGNMWLLISGAVDYGLYKISRPLPTTAVANLTATQLVPPNTASPAGSFGGVAFDAVGNMFLSSNSPSNRLYRLNTTYTLSFVSNLALDGIGNDLTSCHFPFGVLAAAWVKLSATLSKNNSATIKWNVLESNTANGYSVEYSHDGTSWKEIHYSIKKANEINSEYTFSQSNLPNGTHSYRIRKTESDGTVAYSTVAKVTVTSNETVSIWPNPAQHVLKVQQGGNNVGTSRLYLVDQTGRLLQQSIVKAGINEINVKMLPPGTYYVRIKNENGVMVNEKFVKQ